ncbi:hypothetical protein Esti_002668 [Eimeria stiedai]
MREDPCYCGLSVVLAVAAGALVVLFAVLWTKFKLTEVEPFLNRERKRMVLIDKSNISPDTRRLVFSLDFPNQPLGLPVGQHLKLFGPNCPGVEAGKWNGKPDPEASFEEISRKYTPVSSASARGKVELLVKVYKKTKTPPFLDGGKMSQYLEGLQIGDQLDVQGPFGRITYHGRGSFALGPRQVTKRQVGLLAGGTGITPIFQLIRRIFEDPADPTHLSLLYANKTEADILLRDELEELENQYPDRISLWFTLDKPPAKWRFSSGFVSQEMIKERMPPPGKETLILCCGPPPMVEYACMQNLLEMGYDKNDVACF